MATLVHGAWKRFYDLVVIVPILLRGRVIGRQFLKARDTSEIDAVFAAMIAAYITGDEFPVTSVIFIGPAPPDSVP